MQETNIVESVNNSSSNSAISILSRFFLFTFIFISLTGFRGDHSSYTAISLLLPLLPILPFIFLISFRVNITYDIIISIIAVPAFLYFYTGPCTDGSCLFSAPLLAIFLLFCAIVKNKVRINKILAILLTPLLLVGIVLQGLSVSRLSENQGNDIFNRDLNYKISKKIWDNEVDLQEMKRQCELFRDNTADHEYYIEYKNACLIAADELEKYSEIRSYEAKRVYGLLPR